MSPAGARAFVIFLRWVSGFLKQHERGMGGSENPHAKKPRAETGEAVGDAVRFGKNRKGYSEPFWHALSRRMKCCRADGRSLKQRLRLLKSL